MVVVSLVVGCVQSVASVAVLELTRAGYVDPALFWLGFDALLATSILLALGAVVVVVLRAHTAPAEEARRVALFSTGFLMCTGLSALYHVLELFSPGSSLSNFRWSPVLLAAEPLRFPGVALLWCSVLAVRVPHLREAVRSAYQQLLARRGTPTAPDPPAARWTVSGRSPSGASRWCLPCDTHTCREHAEPARPVTRKRLARSDVLVCDAHLRCRRRARPYNSAPSASTPANGSAGTGVSSTVMLNISVAVSPSSSVTVYEYSVAS